MKQVDIIAITISSPLKIGIYQEDKLIETIEDSGKTSDVLAVIFEDLLKKYKIKKQPNVSTTSVTNVFGHFNSVHGRHGSQNPIGTQGVIS